ncbi:hypothetical protein [Rhodanobacter sp. PCA2]|uniref:hypothetical protein n=1 Tax=Rhodanobacter sp. PCA2 TaxID=2006117 RepID=UPI0015E77EF8|nr:hypothetical protein [Rhodanobacter sp. PCA2]MBA2077770.1 hypothetical protein [Rhodanobacter sp. PCA2]
MQSRTRFIALGLACVALAACSHKDRNAPLAFAPADTPYAVANLAPLDDDTRKALLAQADLQLPSQLAQLEAFATRQQSADPDAARLVRALGAELKGKTIEGFAQANGIDLKGRFALYGEGMAPVLRSDLADPKAFEGFLDRLETAYGKKLDTATIGTQRYRRQVFPASGTELVLAVTGKQLVAALLPADPATPLLRLALGLDRPAKSLQDDNRLADLARDKGYAKWLVGQFDLVRALPLMVSGSDPLIAAIRIAHASAESAKTGEPVPNLLQASPACAPEAGRIAARVPSMSFGYTRLDATHQDVRFDLALAADITKAFSSLKVDLPGLGGGGTAPFDLSLALPVAPLRTFWAAQADAVAATPFTCPMLTDLNDAFAKLGDAAPKAAIPPFGNLLGLRLALDTLQADKTSSLPAFTGRIVLGSTDPAGLLATGQMMVPALARLKPVAGGAPVALPKDMSTMFGGPAWLASGDKALALGAGAGEDAKLAGTLQDPVGGPGQMARMHLSGAMYLDWLKFMEAKSDGLANAAAVMSKNDEPGINGGEGSPADEAAQAAADAARTKAQFAAMEAQAQRVDGIDAEMHVTGDGIVVTSHTTLKQ